MLYKDKGELEKARVNLEKALQIYLKCYGTENNIYIATNYNNLGTMYKE